ncbi:hypothetical protein NDU88_002916 [Pleurodeles waltl]|uniref:Uncharacterized protein n=1 Tax=Pleurodeles waltl TaxID=8319 RepID=A0AAV7MP29_PLEWA|nr:hypothetical protein NDU88_002916 [Pleurodeles waltl]
MALPQRGNRTGRVKCIYTHRQMAVTTPVVLVPDHRHTYRAKMTRGKGTRGSQQMKLDKFTLPKDSRPITDTPEWTQPTAELENAGEALTLQDITVEIQGVHTSLKSGKDSVTTEVLSGTDLHNMSSKVKEV